MSLWIRSQDKESLVDCVVVDMTKNWEKQYTIQVFVSGFNGMYPIGTYSTREKALNVLDMIQETIKGRKTTDYGISENGDFVSNNYFEKLENIVFQMPQDDEV